MRPDLSSEHNRFRAAIRASEALARSSAPKMSQPQEAVPGNISPSGEHCGVPPAFVAQNSGCAEVPLPQAGRRSAPRLRLSLPAKLIAIEQAHTCIVLNLSRTGAQIAILDALREGEGAILQCGVIDHFAIVSRSEFGLNALVFDEPLSDSIVLETRRYQEHFEEHERRALLETARRWATGDTDEGRSI